MVVVHIVNVQSTILINTLRNGYDDKFYISGLAFTTTEKKLSVCRDLVR